MMSYGPRQSAFVDRINASEFLVQDICQKFDRLPGVMQTVKDILDSETLADSQPTAEFPVELCSKAAELLHSASSTSQLFHELINLCTINTPPETCQDHTLKTRLQEFQGKLARMEGHMSAGISELSETIRLALQKAPIWHIHNRSPHLAIIGYREHGSPTKRTPVLPMPGDSMGVAFPGGLHPPTPGGCMTPDPGPGQVCGSLPQSDINCSPTSQRRSDFPSNSPTKRALYSKVWSSTDPDAMALAKFTAAAAAHNIRRVALALLAAVCLVEREMQQNRELSIMLLGESAKRLWGEQRQVRAQPIHHGYM